MSSINLLNKWRAISIERKILLGWMGSLFVVLTLGAVLYLSKQELHQSSKVINQNNGLHSATQDVFASIQALEISSKRFIITGSSADSIKYFENLDSLRANVLQLEPLLKDQPRFFKFYLPIKNTISNELSRINHLSFTIKNAKTFDVEIFRTEEEIYKKLDDYWQLLEDEEELASTEEIQVLNSKINQNLNFFLILIFTYIALLTVLFFVINSDVKKRRELAARVSESRKNLRTIIDTAPALIFVKNIEKKFTLLNKSFLNYFNADKDDLLHNDNEIFFTPGERQITNEEDDAVIKNRISLTNIVRKITLQDGRAVWLNINKAPMLDEDDNAVGIVGVMDDISRRMEFQAALLKTQKELEELNKQKDKFFSIIAHDLRSPFTGMLGFVEILSDEYEKLTEQEKEFYINNIRSSLKSLLLLIDNLLTWARLNLNRLDFNPTPLYLTEIVYSVFRTLKLQAANKKIEIHSDFKEDLEVFADPYMTETIIRNLVSNAIKFTNQDGLIKVSASAGEKFVKIDVEDNGTGMTPETAEKLFHIDANVTTKGTSGEKGTGLGLILCKEFIEKHGGSITVKSEVGKGTIISFTLPKNEQPN